MSSRGLRHALNGALKEPPWMWRQINGGPHQQSSQSHSVGRCLAWPAEKGVIYNRSTQPSVPETHKAGPCGVIWGQPVKMCVRDEPRHPALCPGVLLLLVVCFCWFKRPHAITGSERFMVHRAASLICLAL